MLHHMCACVYTYACIYICVYIYIYIYIYEGHSPAYGSSVTIPLRASPHEYYLRRHDHMSTTSRSTT